ncbi:Protein CBG18766 [Caenorhabditis briggsae]|uniref:Protein CBG18766 n=1 Tax=Caenorhabditis briggsae TaxID=6238 RepID=A8XU30_CAEBR|nr:Protein CBG18766 [Caenorhabditis briggsae]CAP36155.2 Protein CBG18766 [Caenorhabditis briggsae]
MVQVKAEYDFDAQPNSGEISIRAGDVLTVIRESIDGGWMEGRNARGSVGLFPEAYVTPYQAQRAGAQPPPVIHFQQNRNRKKRQNPIQFLLVFLFFHPGFLV